MHYLVEIPQNPAMLNAQCLYSMLATVGIILVVAIIIFIGLMIIKLIFG